MATKVLVNTAAVKLGSIESRDIPEGTYFFGCATGEQEQSLYVRSYSNVMKVSDPHCTWSIGGGRFTHYQPVEKIEINVMR